MRVLRRIAVQVYRRSLGLIADAYAGRGGARRGDPFMARVYRRALARGVPARVELARMGGAERVRRDGWAVVALQGLVMVYAGWWAVRLRDLGWLAVSRWLGAALVVVTVGWAIVAASGAYLLRRLSRG